MTVAVSPSPTARRTLTVCGGAHALHDGFTDRLNVLYPLLQAQCGLSYAAICALKTVYSGAMASFQVPAGITRGGRSHFCRRRARDVIFEVLATKRQLLDKADVRSAAKERKQTPGSKAAMGVRL